MYMCHRESGTGAECAPGIVERFEVPVLVLAQKSKIVEHKDVGRPGGKGFEKSGLDLRTYKSLMKGTKFGPVVTPGSRLTSTLNVLVSGHADPAISMPFGIKGGLPKDKVDLLNQWVNQGAKDN